VRTPLDAGPGDASEVSARIFSGSGDPGLPAGLFLGTALLPRTAAAGEEREIRLRFEVEPADVRRLFVRRSPDPTRAAP